MQRYSVLYNYLSYNNVYDDVNLNSFLVFLRNKSFTEKDIDNFMLQYIKDFYYDFFTTLLPFLSYMNFVRFMDEDFIRYTLDNHFNDIRKTLQTFSYTVLNNKSINNYSENHLLSDIVDFTSEYSELGIFTLLLYFNENFQDVKKFINFINDILQNNRKNFLKDKIVNTAKSLNKTKLTYFKISLNKTIYNFYSEFLNIFILVAKYFNFSDKYEFVKRFYNSNLNFHNKIKSNLGMLTHYDLNIFTDYKSYKDILKELYKNKISLRDLLQDSIVFVLYKNFGLQSYRLNDNIRKHFIDLPLTDISSFILFCSEMLDLQDINNIFIDFSIYDEKEFLKLPLYINKRLKCINEIVF